LDPLSLILLLACSDGDKDSPDSGGDTEVDTVSVVDTHDTGPPDTNPPETDPPDTDPPDTGPTTDEDGDGFGPETDCDDNHPWTYPGADEWCDLTDHDCDGEALEEGVCDKAQEMLGLAALTASGPEGYLDVFGSYGFAGDLDADGVDDLFTLCSACELPDGGRGYVYGFVPGGQGWQWSLEGHELDVLEFTDQGFELGGPARHLDFNGDGFEDWVRTSSGGTTVDHGGTAEKYLGVAYLLEGPSDTWEDGLGLQDVASRTFYHDGLWAQQSHAPGDLDGDGYDDLVFATVIEPVPLPKDASITPHLGIVFGEPTPTEPVETWGEEEFATLIYGDDWLGDEMSSGDFDGDGHADLLVNDYHDATYVISGPDLRGADGAQIEDVAHQVWAADANCVAGLGDWNADGYDDWVAGEPSDSDYAEQGGGLYFVAGSAESTEVDSWNAGANGILHGEANVYPLASYGSQLGHECDAGDLDGDSRRELEIEGYSAYYTTRFLLNTDELPEGVAAFEPSMSLVKEEEDMYLLLPSGVSFGDWDGDGINDLHLNGYNHALVDGPGGFAIIPGWDIPWGEEPYW